MLLNNKNKCPVCSDECITLRDRLQILNKGNINCCNCNACLSFAPLPYIITIPIAIFCIAMIFLESYETRFNVLYILYAILTASFILFCDLKNSPELEEHKVVKPAFNLNEFLDDLKNSNCKG